MGQFNLNLSTRPFKAYRAANLGLVIMLLVLVAVSAFQVYNYQQNSSLAGSIRPTEQKLRAESERLTKDLQLLNSKMYSGNAAAKISQVQLLNELIEKKKFSWTRVFATLEQVTPENVYLMSLGPFLGKDGRIGLNLAFRGRTFTDAAEFVKVLETSDVFADTVVGFEEKVDSNPNGEVNFALSTYYVPPPTPAEKRAE